MPIVAGCFTSCSISICEVVVMDEETRRNT